MTSAHDEEIRANLERADRSVQAARELNAIGYHDFAASRAYYAAFHAVTALLLHEGIATSKHSGAIALSALLF